MTTLNLGQLMVFSYVWGILTAVVPMVVIYLCQKMFGERGRR